MKKLLIIAVCAMFTVACENRRTDDGSTSRAPSDNETTEKDRNAKDDRTSPIADSKDKDRDRNEGDEGGILDRDRSETERIDRSVALAGRSIFMSECASCHRVVDKDKDGVDNDKDKKYAGPELTEITDRRNDRWLVKFMTNTDGVDHSDDDPDKVCMVQKKGKELNRDQALKVLEYLHMRNVSDDAK